MPRPDKNYKWSSRIVSCGLLFKIMAICILIAMPFSGIFAQRYNLSIFNISNGLPGNQINDIIQDKAGRLWIGTMNGVAIYDGLNFTGFDKNNPVTNNPVKTIFQDSKGNIWIGMIRKGICKYNGTSFEFFNTTNGLLRALIELVPFPLLIVPLDSVQL